jgi:Ser/Thr protein kinase RdoA (MazF antagonist)
MHILHNAEICPLHARSAHRMATLNSIDNKVYRVQKKVTKQYLTVTAHVKEVNQIKSECNTLNQITFLT